jgi:hypothetical protein
VSEVVIVGQAPSRTSRPRRPLRDGRTGLELRRLFGDALEELRLVNVLGRWPGSAGAKGDLFPREAARRAGRRLRRRLAGRRVVVLGRRVEDALGLELPRPLVWTDQGDLEAALLPHPSGVNLWWNEARNRSRARAFARRIRA